MGFVGNVSGTPLIDHFSKPAVEGLQAIDLIVDGRVEAPSSLPTNKSELLQITIGNFFDRIDYFVISGTSA